MTNYRNLDYNQIEENAETVLALLERKESSARLFKSDLTYEVFRNGEFIKNFSPLESNTEELNLIDYQFSKN
jgi:hypothetical protein